MFGKKSLNEQINDFLNKINMRQAKIKERVTSLEAEAAGIKSKIQSETKRLIDCELSENNQGQDECNKNIRQLQLEQDRVSGLIDAYKAESGNASKDKKALLNIRATAVKDREARFEKIRTLTAARVDMEHQLQDIEEKINQTGIEINRTRVDVEARALLRIVRFIEPKCVKIPEQERVQYLEAWLDDNNERMARILARWAKPEPEQKMVHYFGQPEKIVHLGPDEQVEPRCIERTVQKIGEKLEHEILGR